MIKPGTSKIRSIPASEMSKLANRYPRHVKGVAKKALLNRLDGPNNPAADPSSTARIRTGTGRGFR